jgi:phage terminase small subunit
MDSQGEEEIPFDPVPSRTGRKDGWTPDRQRQFIAALARCGSVTAAARHVGMSASSAYRLLDREGADSFAAAWDLAAEMGRDRMRDCSIDRATNGAWVPVMRRGKIVRMEFRYFDRLAVAVLGGRDSALADTAEDRAEARAIRRRQRAEARRQAEAEKEMRRAHHEARARKAEPKPRALPRIRSL